ncbi:MAG: phage integrase SAM-like domain-containing protein [Bacteroidota bacterium]
MPRVTTPTPRVVIKRKNKKEQFGYLFLTLRWNGNFLIYNIGQKVEFKYWDAKAGRTIFNKKYGQQYIDLNKSLRNHTEHLGEYQREHLNITLDALKLELDYYFKKKERPRSDGKKNLSFFEFIESYIQEEKSKANNKRGTWKKFITVFGNLKQYAKDRKRKLNWTDIDWLFRNDFVNWMYSKPREFSINNAAKVMEVVKQFMNEGLRRRYHSHTIHQEPKFGVQRIKLESKLILTFEELKQLIELDLSRKPRWEKVRDLFVVGCYSALRFSDWHKVNDSIIVEDGIKMIEVLTEKTRQLVIVPVLPELETILKKYDNHLPKATSQEVNRVIKLICKEILKDKTYLKTYSKAGQKLSKKQLRWKDISSHCCRRSFATNFYELGVPPSDLMLITGHSTEKQFFGYIVLDKKKQARRFKTIVDRQQKKRYLDIVKAG